MSKYFTPADFSDFERPEVSGSEPPKNHFEKPSKEKLQEIQDKIELEFKRCGMGQSRLNPNAIQVSTTIACNTFKTVLFNHFNETNIEQFVDSVKQDYGFLMAEWVAQLFEPYYPAIIKRVPRN